MDELGYHPPQDFLHPYHRRTQGQTILPLTQSSEKRKARRNRFGLNREECFIAIVFTTSAVLVALGIVYFELWYRYQTWPINCDIHDGDDTACVDRYGCAWWVQNECPHWNCTSMYQENGAINRNTWLLDEGHCGPVLRYALREQGSIKGEWTWNRTREDSLWWLASYNTKRNFILQGNPRRERELVPAMFLMGDENYQAFTKFTNSTLRSEDWLMIYCLAVGTPWIVAFVILMFAAMFSAQPQPNC